MVENKFYKTDFDYIQRLNAKQTSWKAKHYDFLNEMKIDDLIKMAGGKKSKIIKQANNKCLLIREDILSPSLI